MEVACLYKCHLDHIRALVRDMTPAPIDNIILHCTHQHSDSFIEYEPSYDVFGINDIAFDMDYIRSIARKVASSICLAVRALTPAKVGYASGAVEEGIASCRRVLTNDRQLVWRGSRPTQELRALPRGHIDPEVGVVVSPSQPASRWQRSITMPAIPRRPAAIRPASAPPTSRDLPRI